MGLFSFCLIPIKSLFCLLHPGGRLNSVDIEKCYGQFLPNLPVLSLALGWVQPMEDIARRFRGQKRGQGIYPNTPDSFSICLFWLYYAACGILVPKPGMEPALPAAETQSLNHRTTREVPDCGFDRGCIPLWLRSCGWLHSQG